MAVDPMLSFHQTQFSPAFSGLRLQEAGAPGSVFPLTIQASPARRISQAISSGLAVALGSLFQNAVNVQAASRQISLSNSSGALASAIRSVVEQRPQPGAPTFETIVRTIEREIQVGGAAQQNRGLDLANAVQIGEDDDERQGNGALRPGQHQFDVTVGGQTFQLSMQVGEHDTNLDVMTRFAQTVNDANIGLTAEVVAGSQPGTSRVQITSNTAGPAGAFNIQETQHDEDEGRSNLIAYLGAATTVQAAENPHTEIERTTETITVQKAPAEQPPATETHRPNDAQVQTVVAEVQRFTSAVNQLTSLLQGTEQLLPPALGQRFQQVLEQAGGGLQPAGLNVSGRGMTINQDALVQSLTENFQGTAESISRFASTISNFAERVATSPLTSFVQRGGGLNLSNLQQNLQRRLVVGSPNFLTNLSAFQGQALDLLA